MCIAIYLLLLIIMNYSACSLTKKIPFPFLLQLTKPDMLHINPSLLQYSDWRGHAL